MGVINKGGMVPGMVEYFTTLEHEQRKDPNWTQPPEPAPSVPKQKQDDFWRRSERDAYHHD